MTTDQMLVFTVGGTEKPVTQKHPYLSACLEIGCCWGVRGSHPCILPTCSESHPIRHWRRGGACFLTHTYVYIQAEYP